MLIFSPSDFFDPTLFFFDFDIFNPMRVHWALLQITTAAAPPSPSRP